MEPLEFSFEGRKIRFEALSADEHVVQAMRKTGTFYEIDVLQGVRESTKRLDRRAVALDIGAFIGTHSVFFAMYCGFAKVLAFEANPTTFPFLEANVRANGLSDMVVTVPRALGAKLGRANVVDVNEKNRGSATIELSEHGETRVSTVDIEIQREQGPITFMKIDVEGAELAVLAGAVETIKRHRPVLCIELNTASRVRDAMKMLIGYWILDCRGWSPTYLVTPTEAGTLRRMMVNSVWILRAALPSTFVALRWYLRRIGRWLTRAR